jgi:hypothetical protein
MKRLVLLFALVTVVTFSALAQDEKKTAGTTLSVGAEVGIPSGDFGDFYKLGLGGSLKVAFPVVTNGSITLSAGYISFSGKEIAGNKIAAINAIPFKAGFRYNVGAGGFYVEPQVGYAIYKAKGTEGSEGGFTWAPNLGYTINKMIDLSARYESTSIEGTSFNHIGFRIAYNFGL